MLERAMDAGINLLATGDVYAEGEGERVIGRALKASGRRHEVLIGTKVDHGRRRVGVTLEDHTDEIGPNESGHSRLNLIRACEASLERLQTDYIDLYQLHRPIPRHSVRRDPAGSRRSGAGGKGPLYRLLDTPGLDGRRGGDGERAQRVCPVCLRRVTLQSARPADRERAHTGVSALGDGSSPGHPWRWGCWRVATPATRTIQRAPGPRLRGGFYADRVTQRGIEVGSGSPRSRPRSTSARPNWRFSGARTNQG